MDPSPPEPVGLVLSDDLIFSSRILGTGSAHGLNLRTAKNAAALVELARKYQPRGVFIDLHNPGLVLPDLLLALGEVCPGRPRLIAYGSHVDAPTLRAARLAGCDVVLPRSKFVEELPEQLPAWLR
jgi:DNA-binding NarL/FixJ family response regulator